MHRPRDPTRRRRKRREKSALPSVPTKYQTRRFRVFSEQRHRRLLDRLRSTYRHQGIVLYVGAGVQRSIGVPGWRELLGRLTTQMMTNPSAYSAGSGRNRKQLELFSSKRATAEIRRAIAAYNRPLLMMARAIKSRMGPALRRAVANTLYWSGAPFEYIFFEIIEGSPRRRQSKDYPRLPSSELIHALVWIVYPRAGWAGVKAIVNYNYDDWLDLKLRDAGIKSVTVTSGRRSSRRDEIPCYHVHGVLRFWPYALNSETGDIGNFLFSEDEYHEEYANPHKWSNVVQTSLLSNQTGLFVGLSLDDPNIRRLIDTTHRQFPRTRHYAVLKRGRSMKDRQRSHTDDAVANMFEDLETQTFAAMGVDILWVDKWDDLPELVRYVGGLDHIRVPKWRKQRNVWDDLRLVDERLRAAER